MTKLKDILKGGHSKEEAKRVAEQLKKQLDSSFEYYFIREDGSIEYGTRGGVGIVPAKQPLIKAVKDYFMKCKLGDK